MSQIHRVPGGPLITRSDVLSCGPRIQDPSAVFNPGAIACQGRVHLMLRVQTRGRETFLVMAQSPDGLSFEIAPEPVAMPALEGQSDRIYHAYDPRLTHLEGSVYAQVALDYADRCGLGLLRSTDLLRWEFLGDTAIEDSRNGVLFPERIGGRYARLERPNRLARAGGPSGGEEIWLSSSADLLAWKWEACVARGRPHFWDELIGPGPPPLKTRAGWLQIYHGVATHFAQANIYQAGALLLDLHDPARVVARTRNNILEPREAWEQTGQVPNVVFPTGLIAEQTDPEGFVMEQSPFLLYYGAADSVVGLASGQVSDLIRACHED